MIINNVSIPRHVVYRKLKFIMERIIDGVISIEDSFVSLDRWSATMFLAPFVFDSKVEFLEQ